MSTAHGPGRWLAVRKPRGQDGFSTLELVVIAPLFVFMLLLIVALGRVQQAGADITGAARDGARAASLSRSADEARDAARQAVTAALAGQSMRCVNGATTSVDTEGFAPGGQVQVSVVCVVPLADIGLSALPGSTTLSRQAVSPIDSFRSS